MKINITTDTNFKSDIKLIKQQAFDEKIKLLKPDNHYIKDWTYKDIRKGKDIYTDRVLDCICGGVVDGDDFVGFHLCVYSEEDAKKYNENDNEAFNIKKVEKSLIEKLNLTNDKLHGLILGGMRYPKDKLKALNELKDIFHKYKISYSIFAQRQDLHYYGRFSMLYANDEDTFYISNSLSREQDTPGVHKELIVNDDEIIYHDYNRVADERNILIRYDRVRKKGNTLDFLKQQFHEVKINNIDRLI